MEKMKRKEYNKPEISVVVFECADTISLSTVSPNTRLAQADVMGGTANWKSEWFGN